MIQQLKTKSELLEELSKKITTAKILPQIRFTVEDWKTSWLKVIGKVESNEWISIPLIIRSSSIQEDLNKNTAGKYKSILNVIGLDEIKNAIDEVINSYGDFNPINQIFIQPMLSDVKCSGVAFSSDPNTGAPYMVINYDESSYQTDTITSGRSNEVRVFYCYKFLNNDQKFKYPKVVELIKEVESYLCSPVDIEFAIDSNDQLFLLQARILLINDIDFNQRDHEDSLLEISRKIKLFQTSNPYLHGSKAIFGIMPDWNPAEIIGVRPRPLALSLYKDLITDNIWAYQRDNYGYKNLRSFPLLVNFHGLPYIDVRVDFNSFIPADIDEKLANKLANYYLNTLIKYPSNHDKVEFEIIYSCYTFDLKQRMQSLLNNGFSGDDCNVVTQSLRKITNKIIHGENGLWKTDIEKINKLEDRRSIVLNSKMDKISKIYWLLEDCKRYGTLPFAGLARAAFIAIQLLKSLVSVGVITQDDYEIFISNLDSISSKMSSDFIRLSKEDFLKEYGHLRPGTYDILTPRYDEDPDRYFSWNDKTILSDVKGKRRFLLSLEQNRQIEALLKDHGIEHDLIGLFDFIKASIEGREYSKFVFTKSLSEAMKLFKELGADLGFSLDDISYSDISCISMLYSSSENVREVLDSVIKKGKKRYSLTRQIVLPPLITSEDDIWSFYLPNAEPNFITQMRVVADVVTLDNALKFQDSIVFIPSADPGFDWIFSQGIKGFVTMYGGVNSHMAIRAGELGIPAVIGAGETLYNKWLCAKTLDIDCSNKQVIIIK